MIGVARVIQSTARSGFEVVDPGEAMLFDEVVVEPETIDDQIVRPPANRIAEFFDIGSQGFGDLQAGGIMIATIEKDSLPHGSDRTDGPQRRGGTGSAATDAPRCGSGDG